LLLLLVTLVLLLLLVPRLLLQQQALSALWRNQRLPARMQHTHLAMPATHGMSTLIDLATRRSAGSTLLLLLATVIGHAGP
jgi:predicted membrane protein